MTSKLSSCSRSPTDSMLSPSKDSGKYPILMAYSLSMQLYLTGSNLLLEKVLKVWQFLEHSGKARIEMQIFPFLCSLTLCL